jgi:hypothetical protein
MSTTRYVSAAAVLVLVLSGGVGGAAPSAPLVVAVRTPNGGNAPQAVTGPEGLVHVVYFKAVKADHGDLFYVRSRDGGETFSQPLRVNSQPNAAMAARHPRLAVGRGGRAHVVWNGVGGADARGMPLLYSRLNDDASAFDPQRNLMRRTSTLDGGATVAADGEGNVYAVWHAMGDGAVQNEQNRRLWVARSADDGKTFDEESPAWDKPTGACGCCYVGAFADADGALYILYRGAVTALDRDMYLIESKDHGRSFTGSRIDGWRTSACPMSTAALGRGRGGVVAGWETEGRVVFGLVRDATALKTPAPGDRKDRKHPVIAANSRGELVEAWTEGMAWKRGGAVAWQVSDAASNPLLEGRKEGVPVDGTAAVFARPDGTFVVMY